MTSFDDTLKQLIRLNDLLKLLIDELHALLSEELDDDGDGVALVLPVVNQMVDNLRTQHALEGDSGYLEIVLERYPSWHPHVEHLLDEQRELQQQLEDVRDRLARNEPITRDMARRLQDWMTAFDAHRHREMQLIQEAFTLDVGVGE